MILIAKKKIINKIVIILLIITIYTIIGYNITNKNKKNQIALETVALPVNNKVVVIDAGHGVPDE